MYGEQTYDALLKRMLSRVPNKLDKREGAVIWDTLSPTAIELQILYLELDNIIKESFGDTASRDFLILRCRERGIAPYEATNTILQGEFTPIDIDVTGKRFSLNELNYVVTEMISGGIYKVQCETKGSVGNQYLGNMVPIEYVDGLQTAVLTDILIPGEDEEGTEELRRRYFDSFEEFAFGGNRADYYKKVRAIEGVGDLKIERAWNEDIHPADMIPTSEVTNWYTNVIDSLDANTKNWLSAVYDAAIQKKLTVGGTILITVVDSDDYSECTPELIDHIQSVLDPIQNAGEGYGTAPIGHVVNVRSAFAREIYISAKIVFNDGFDWGSMREEIKAAINEYLLQLRKNWAKNTQIIVRISQIEARIINIENVVDITDTLINNNADNLILEEYEIPVFGGVFNDT